jgi:Arc/MetJ-type ribon-helix-helix transcriptional regulator
MAFTTTEEIDRIVKAKVESGEYGSEAEVLMAALRSLLAKDEEVAAIEAGIADVRAGRTQAFPEVQAALRQEFPFLKDE